MSDKRFWKGIIALVVEVLGVIVAELLLPDDEDEQPPRPR